MPAWAVWAIAAVLLAVGEIFTPGLFFLGPVALAAVLAGLFALLGLERRRAADRLHRRARSRRWPSSGPIARRTCACRPRSAPAPPRSPGRKALVLQRVDVNGGRVRIGGEEWSARAFMEDQVFEPGTQVEVVKIEGATALVYE